MALLETRDPSGSNKRLFNYAFHDDSACGPQKKSSSLPLDLDDSRAAKNYLSDDAALLLAAFASQSNEQSRPEVSVATVPRPSSPAISDEISRSDSSSDTTILSSSRTLDSSSDEEDDDSSVFYSDSLPVEPKSGDSEASGSSPVARRRVGQHFNKRRHRTSAEQLRVLEMTYAGNKVPNQELRKDLAIQLGMTTRRVQIWFQNKRAKEKRLKLQAQHKLQQGYPTASVTSTSSTTSTTPASPSSNHSVAPHTTSFVTSNSSTTADSYRFQTQEHAAPFPVSAPRAPSNSTSNMPLGYPPQSFMGAAPPTLSTLLANSMREAQRLGWGAHPQLSQPFYPAPFLQYGPPAYALPHQAPAQLQQFMYPAIWSLPSSH